MDVFEVINTTRAMRRLKPDPVPDELVWKVLDAAIRAPSGGNRQPWNFIVVRDETAKKKIAEWYLEAWNASYGPMKDAMAANPDAARMFNSADHLANHLAEVPVVIIAAIRGGDTGTSPAGSYVYPAIQNITKYVIDKGKSQTSKDKVGENLYNRGVMNSVIVAEAIRNAQKLSGKKAITSEDMRRGLETLQITAARWKEIGLDGFGPPIDVTCDDHNGHHAAYVQQWDGTKWVKTSDWIPPMKDKVIPLLDAAAKDYVTKNQPWPKRTESCDKSS